MLARLIAEQQLTISTTDLEGMSLLLDTVFFASLMIEEGEHVRIAIVYHVGGAAGLSTVVDDSAGKDPVLAWDVTAIPKKPFDAPTLAKLSRGIEYGAQLVVVGGIGNALWIDGVARIRHRADGGSAIRIAAPRAGVIVLERHVDQILRFEAGQQMRRPIDVVGSDGAVRRAIRAITRDHGDIESDITRIDCSTICSYSESALRRLIQKMHATGYGALLALLPHEPSADMLRGVQYGRVDPMLLSTRIQADKDLIRGSLSKRIAKHDESLDHDEARARDAAQNAADVAAEELEAAIEDVAQLSAIDGAVLGGPRLAIYGAGYLIPAIQLPAGTVRQAFDASGETWEPYPARFGARHSAAFSFAYQNPDAVVFIVSEDGPVSCALRVGEHVLVWSVAVLET
ncbi:MAG TPA: hypothetical protein VIV40_39950 [Kofleriaceae bacterium]